MAIQLSLLGPSEVAWSDASSLSLKFRESSRARHLILQVLPPSTVEIVVPRGTRPIDVQRFVRENNLWIERARQELESRYRGRGNVLPQVIELEALGETVDVCYEHALSARQRRRFRSNRLELRCQAEDFSDAPGLLRSWLMEQARSYLKPWLAVEAKRLGASPRSVQIRLQRTRWGSCSSAGTVSLNASLMLVAPELVRYLLVHELCHLRHLNHSPRYWKTVAQYEPDFRSLDRRLAEAWPALPAWIMAAAGGA